MNRFKIGLVLVAGCLVPWTSATALAQSKPGESELAALQGTWRYHMVIEDGREEPPQKTQIRRLIIVQDRVTYQENGVTIAEGRVEIDPTTEPKRLDWHYTTGQTDVTIYVRSGKFITQCGNRDGRTRPTEFATGRTNGGAYVVILEHVKY